MSLTAFATNPVAVRRLECTAVLAASLFAYQQLGFSWLQFALLFFIPDLSIFAYRASRELGGLAYNAAHCFLWPVALGIYSWQAGDSQLQSIALIWLAHCAFDRAIGWGLKYPDSFCNTDMGVKTLAIDNQYLR